ncbi:Crp/Fnr family transcriptional regulator [Acetobacter orientalis]|uniref:Crp/Fnr family transcriptional regulator n=1 Tax=Acetobacter orientalis TaxID=146474 RepID=A0A2Z5ZD00_9PROT|nr:Crp/Fnr family transcriptional regulator [Acetobacter orientalis]
MRSVIERLPVLVHSVLKKAERANCKKAYNALAFPATAF